MIVELINTGTELMMGRVLNTHQQWLCRQLADRGYLVNRQVAVADSGPEIQQAVRESLTRADLVIVTGGLGPTSDDLTLNFIARLLGKSLHEDDRILAHIKEFFARRNRSMPERVRVQALVPDGAVVLPNPHGTAPGLAIELKPNLFRADQSSGWLILLPGPPRELRPMFFDSVVPLLGRELPMEREFVCRTLRTIGLPESLAQERIEPALRPMLEAGLAVGYCARPVEVDVRLSAQGTQARVLVQNAETVVREQLGRRVYGADDEDLAMVLVRSLTERRQTLALAESCTGGCIAHQITNVPGASVVLLTGLVVYSNQAKQTFLGVRSETLVEHGAVSEVVAWEMADGARRTAGADFALSVTGIAGPTGGTDKKPVGTVFIGLSSPSGTVVERHFNPFDRETFKRVTAQQALNQLRLALI